MRASAAETDSHESLPRMLDRKSAARLITREYFPIKERSLANWPIAWRLVAGRAVAPTTDLMAEAERRLAAAPVIGSKDHRQ